MQLDAVMWPDRPWPELRAEWQLAERFGIGRGWLWDHLTLGGRPVWHDAYVTLAAAAASTESVGIGTMVTAPNFRHPVTTAKAALAIDSVSGGRFVLGLGAGGPGADAEALGVSPLTPGERGRRFVEFVEQIHTLLTEPQPTIEGEWFTARAADVGGAPPRRPDVAIAATGPQGISVAARHADWFVTQDIVRKAATPHDEVRRQFTMLRDACEQLGTPFPKTVVVLGYGGERPLASPAALVDCMGRYAELGADRIAVLWPRGEDERSELAVIESSAAVS